MKTLRKFFVLLIAMMLVLQITAVSEEFLSDSEFDYSNTEIIYPELEYDLDELIVGNPTRLTGKFFTGMFGNATSDLDVRYLLHGYNLIYWDNDNSFFATDPTVVNSIYITEDDTSDRTYYITINEDLFYSDGSPITAWDYAFSWLLQISPEVEKIGGIPVRIEHIKGYDSYLNKTTSVLSGIRVLSDYVLSVTVNHEYLPFFYELGMLDCVPYPINEIAPGCKVADDGEGIYIANVNSEVTDPIFTSELLQKTIMDSENGYLSHPHVVSGPYTLVSFDGLTAEFTLNEYYKGNPEGLVPTILRLKYTLADNDSMIQELSEGKWTLLNKVTRAETIQEGMNLVGDDIGFSMGNYARNGLSFFSFCCEKNTVGDHAVRQAIAWCLNKEALVSSYVGYYGQRVDGWYGIGQWMYGIVNGTIAYPVELPENPTTDEIQAYEAEIEAWEQLNLDGIETYQTMVDEDTWQAVDYHKASQLLDEAGWNLNYEGKPFITGVDEVRCKKINDELVPLKLKLIYPKGNKIEELLDENFISNLEEVGIQLQAEPMEMEKLLRAYYRQDNRDADMIYLATNFDVIYDPSVNFRTMSNEHPTWNNAELEDQELFDLAIAMRQTEPGDVLGYVQKWILFQERFSKVLPMLPIYSNVYFDFYPNVLHDYIISANTTWSQAIDQAYLSDSPLEVEVESDELLFE